MFFVFIANRSPTLTSFKIWKTRLEQTPFWRLKFLCVGLCDRQPSRETLCLSSWTHTPVCSQPQWMKAGLGNQEELQKYPKAGSPKTSGLLSCCSGSLSLGEVKGHDLTLQHCGEVCGEGNWKEPCVCVCVCVCACVCVCVCPHVSHGGTGFSSANQAFWWLGFRQNHARSWSRMAELCCSQIPDPTLWVNKRLLFFGLPRWCSGTESSCQCRRHKRRGFDPWVRKIPWRRKWQSTPVFLPGKSHGRRGLVGYHPWGHKESTQLSVCTHTHTQTHTLF